MREPTIKDSGERRVFNSGAHRDRAAGKGAFNLLPYEGLLRVAKIFEGGAAKYTANNWRLGMPVSEYLNSATRHILKAVNGWTDEDHIAMAAWNCLCAIETQAMVERGHLPESLADVQDWLSDEGVASAMSATKEENDRRLAKGSPC